MTRSGPPARRWFGLAAAPRLNLALQGGGAHGAFTWGVLDGLLDEPDLTFEGLSGSSAGAMNAVVFAEGWRKDGRDGARAALAEFWGALGTQLPWGVAAHGEGDTIMLSSVGKLMTSWAGHFTPAQLNPFDLNPLRDLLKAQVDFDALRARSPFKLFIGTTQASTGKLRIFREHELTLDVLLASACLPKIHHPIEIDGEVYWDGGYCANPAVFPLFYECESRDVLLVPLSPLRHTGVPHSAEEIDARIAELAFSAHFMREMSMFERAAEYASADFVAMGRLERRLRRIRFHMIDASELASLQRTDTKLLAYGPFLELLHGQGRERAAAWSAAHRGAVGHHATIDLKAWFG